MENGQFQMALVKKLSFPRWGGTEAEARAAKILLEELEKAGGEGEVMEFPIPAFELQKCAVTVTEPFLKALPCAPYGLSGEIDADLRLLYAGEGSEAELEGAPDLSDCAVLVNGFEDEVYGRLCERHAAAFLTVSGVWYTPERQDLIPETLRPGALEHGHVPGLKLRARDATELVRNGAKTLRVTLCQRPVEHVSRNVMATVPGTDLPGESIVICAHYDSECVGEGALDNASGTANVMALYRHFVKNPARRTLRFIWFGSEEQGLLGSREYVRRYKERGGTDIRFCVNYDMCGTVLGCNEIDVVGAEGLVPLVEGCCKEAHFPAVVAEYDCSSDSRPFSELGIPCANPSRYSFTVREHSRFDTAFPLGAAAFGEMEAFSMELLKRIDRMLDE